MGEKNIVVMGGQGMEGQKGLAMFIVGVILLLGGAYISYKMSAKTQYPHQTMYQPPGMYPGSVGLFPRPFYQQRPLLQPPPPPQQPIFPPLNQLYGALLPQHANRRPPHTP